jgi:predicted NAD/FAD-dependent oxidoreductase
MKVAIIGAGMAGLACAEGLAKAGVAATIFDKGRGPGGRMATRRLATPLGEAHFDHGAQYFTVRDPGFRARVAAWREQGLVTSWPAAGDDAIVGAPTMNAPIKQMASGQDVRWSARVDGLERDGERWRVFGDGLADEHFEGVVVAAPAEQAAALLRPGQAAMAEAALATLSQPCWTLMLAFDQRLSTDEDCLREAGPICWAARNSSKPGRTGPETWVVQAGPAWSVAHLDDEAETVAAALLAAFTERLGAVPPPIARVAHRWRYARSGSLGKPALWNRANGVGVCGDWLLGPRIECAWRSGDALAAEILRSR